MKYSSLNSFFSLKNRYLHFVIFIWIVFLAFKFPALTLPYFWDEAWSYIPAISLMAKNGLSLLPDALHPSYSRGHPLFFYFIYAGWMKLFGSSPFVMHLFAMIISSALIFSIYWVGARVFTPIAAVYAVLLFCLQSVFIAQSSFVLPEVLLTLLMLLSMYFFISGMNLLFIFTAVVMLFTKETGLILLISLGTWHIVTSIFSKEIGSKVFFIKSFVIFLPVGLAFTYFILQYYTYGWFLFPEHTGMMDFQLNSVWNKFQICFRVIFNNQGRFLFTVISVISVVLFLIKHDNFSELPNKKMRFAFVAISLIFIALILVFSSVNFFTDRYLLCALPFYILSAAYVITDVIKFEKNWFLNLIYLIPVAALLKYNTGSYPPADYNLSYLDGVKIQKDVTLYVEQNNFYRKKIYVSFLYAVCLGVPETKFRSTKELFYHINNNLSCENDIIIHSNIEEHQGFKEFEKNCSLTLLRKFERGKVWADIYKVEK